MEQVKWKTSPRLFLLLAVLFLASFSSWGQEEPEEMSTQEILTELIQSNKQKAKDLKRREEALILTEQSLKQTETRLDLRESALNERESLLSEREASMIEMQSFSQSLREELTRRRNSEYWRGFGHGFAAGGFVGATGGGYLGFKIGISY